MATTGSADNTLTPLAAQSTGAAGPPGAGSLQTTLGAATVAGAGQAGAVITPPIDPGLIVPTPLRLNTFRQDLAMTDPATGQPTTEFHRRLNDILERLTVGLNAVTALPLIQQALKDLQGQQAAAVAATNAANAAAVALQAQTAEQARAAALTNSFVVPAVVVSANSAAVSVVDHTRTYADGRSVAVQGGVKAHNASAGDTVYVSYVDAARLGGAVAYQASTTPPTQAGDVHVVGAVLVPAAGGGTSTGGRGPSRPGYVIP